MACDRQPKFLTPPGEYKCTWSEAQDATQIVVLANKKGPRRIPATCAG